MYYTLLKILSHIISSQARPSQNQVGRSSVCLNALSEVLETDYKNLTADSITVGRDSLVWIQRQKIVRNH